MRASLTSFIGREHEVARVGAALDSYRLVTLVGPGGAGKTRLATEVAAEVAGRARDGAPDGVWMAELASVTDAADVPHAVLGSIGLRESRLRTDSPKRITARDAQSQLLEPGLARAAGADQGDEPVAVQGGAHPGDLCSRPMKLVSETRKFVRVRPAIRTGAAGRSTPVRARRPGRHGRDLAAQHLQVRGLHVRPGVDAELIGQPRPQRLVHGQRLHLPAGGGQRAHQQGGELLIQRMRGDQRLGSATCAAARPASIARPICATRASRRSLSRRWACGAAKSPTSASAGPRHSASASVIEADPCASSRSNRSASTSSGVTASRYPAADCSTAAGAAQGAPRPGDERLQRVGKVRGRILSPQTASASVPVLTGLTAGQRQPGDQVTQPRASDGHQLAGVVADLERPEY